MMQEVNPAETTRAYAFEMWMKAPMPMVTLIKTLDVTRLHNVSRKRGLKFNMLMCWCIGRAASQIQEFYMLPVGDKLIKYDAISVNTIVVDISPDANLDEIFRPLENSRTSEMLLGKEKARLRNTPRHASWLRIYAIKLEPGIYVITGDAIKLTRNMQEREHTLVELARMEKVRRFLIENEISDKDSFDDYLRELN